MTPPIDHVSEQEPLTCEAGGWITCCLPRSDLEMMPLDLLERSAVSRPGNMRLAIIDRRVYLLGEIRDPEGLLSLVEARQRLLDPFHVPDQEVSPEDVACILAETGYAWQPLEEAPDCWSAVATDASDQRCKLSVSITRHGVEVRAQLSAWDGILAESSRAALARFLTAFHGQIRFARCILQPHAIQAVSFAAADRLDVELRDSLAAVLMAYQRCWREVRALTDETVIRIYLEAIQ